MSRQSIAAILQESGIEPQAKRQRVEDTISDLIASAAEKTASCAADAAVAKCNAIWEEKIGELCARAPSSADVKIGAPEASLDPSANAGSPAKVPAIVKEQQPKKSARECAHEACMQSAAASALVGIRLEHGGPFGASVVRDGVIIACAHNMVLTNKDPTCHAEMTAIRQACKTLGTHDLSDCELYTTCEPCPMCWGAIRWARLGKAYLGVDRHTAAKYGFDDKVFYDEIDGKSGVYGWKRFGFMKDSSSDLVIQKEMIEKNMVEIYDGVLREECEGLFTNPAVNRTLRLRYGPGTELIQQAVKETFPDSGIKRPATLEGSPQISLGQHEQFMKRAVAAAEQCAKNGMSKEREPFAAVIVKDGLVLATACNSVISSRDSTSTAEINAIQAASTNLGTYNLEGCEMYTTVQPDVMSLGAILWSRISRVYCGVTQQFAAQYGFEHGTLHFKDLLTGVRSIPVERGVAQEECEAVFKEWSDRNGVIY